MLVAGDYTLPRAGSHTAALIWVNSHEGEVLDMLVQSRRDSRAALRLMRKLLKSIEAPLDEIGENLQSGLREPPAVASGE